MGLPKGLGLIPSAENPSHAAVLQLRFFARFSCPETRIKPGSEYKCSGRADKRAFSSYLDAYRRATLIEHKGDSDVTRIREIIDGAAVALEPSDFLAMLNRVAGLVKIRKTIARSSILNAHRYKAKKVRAFRGVSGN